MSVIHIIFYLYVESVLQKQYRLPSMRNDLSMEMDLSGILKIVQADKYPQLENRDNISRLT